MLYSLPFAEDFGNRITEGTPQDPNLSSAVRIERYRDEPETFMDLTQRDR